MPGLILAATLGGTITMTLGYSRILHAACAEGNLFRIFGRVHPVGHFPTVSLLAISAVAVALCWSFNLFLRCSLSSPCVCCARKFVAPTACGFTRYPPSSLSSAGFTLRPRPISVSTLAWHRHLSIISRAGRLLCVGPGRQRWPMGRESDPSSASGA
jgi:hypothetical protein